MLIVILQGERVFLGDEIIEIGNGLVSDEICRLGEEDILRKVEVWRDIRICRREQLLAVRQLGIQHFEGHRIHVSGGNTGGRVILSACWLEVVVSEGCECGRVVANLVCDPERRGSARRSNLKMGNVSVLVAEEAEKLVFDQRKAERSARHVTVQRGHFFVAWDVAILLIEKRSGVQAVAPVMKITAAVNRVGTGKGAHVDMCAAGRSLLCVVHRSVDAKFLNRFWSGRRQRLADGEEGSRQPLNNSSTGAAGAGNARIVDDAGGCDRTRGFAVEQIACVDAIEQKSVAGIALAVGPYRLIAESRIGAGAGRPV